MSDVFEVIYNLKDGNVCYMLQEALIQVHTETHKSSLLITYEYPEP